MPNDHWLPRTPLEALIKIDTTLAGILPRITAARRRIIDILPGHSGRPAGNGEPGGGTGATFTTIVERTALTASSELRDLTRIDQLVNDILNQTDHLAHRRLRIHLEPPPNATHAQRLALTRWALRQLIRIHAQPSTHLVEPLWQRVNELDTLINTWATPHPAAHRTSELAADDTDTWCRSHLRIGHRTHRHDRYRNTGLCRTCGDFQAEQGWLPTLDILDALVNGTHGSTIAKMIRDEHDRRKGKKRRRK